MKVIYIAIIIFSFGLLVCCSNKDDSHYFNGEIRYFDESKVTTQNVESKFVPLDEVNVGMIAVYDSLLVCWSPQYPDYFFNVFNVDTGEKIGSFCGKGRGHQEVLSVSCIFQFFKKGNDIMTLLDASSEHKLFFWNISQSIEKGVTVYDTILPYDTDYMLFHFPVSEDTLFAYKSSRDLGEREATTPFYEKRTIYTNEVIRKYPIYKMDSIENTHAGIWAVSSFFYTWDVMKPDGSKIVQVMSNLPQINIIDTHTGNIVGYRMKNGPGFSLLATDMEAMNEYYISAHADDNYIYATYWGKEQWGDRPDSKTPLFNTIHVFDWDGKLLCKLITDQSYFRVWLDPVRKRLYAININTDEVYYLDLKELSPFFNQKDFHTLRKKLKSI